MKLPEHFSLIGDVGLSDYKRCLDEGRHPLYAGADTKPITKRAYARVGLVGNPSDGFYGKTISLAISNYWAEATIAQSERLVLERHPLNDPTEFGSLADLHGISRKEGYQGGLRLMQATCKKFFEYCCEHGIAIARRNFRLKYDTNIPRQVCGAAVLFVLSYLCICILAHAHGYGPLSRLAWRGRPPSAHLCSSVSWRSSTSPMRISQRPCRYD